MGSQARARANAPLAETVRIGTEEPVRESDGFVEMQQRLGRVSPLLFLLDWIGQRSDEKVANFSIKVAREQSWRIARELATLPPLERPARIERVDTSVTELSSILKQPKSRLLRTVLGIIRRFESSDLQRVIEVLKSSADFQVREP